MDFADDTRGVSEVIGVLLIFSFLIIAFVGYQATVVPSQNAEIEFQHSQAVEEDFLGVRSAILNANEQTTQTQAIQLGTEYPARLLALNAPPVSGRVTTSTLGEYRLTGAGTTVSDVCAYDGAVTTPQVSRLHYDPSYRYQQDEPTANYENTLSYHGYESGTARITGEQLLIQDSTVRLYPLHADEDVSASSSGTQSLTFSAGRTASSQVTVTDTESVTLTVPTKLDAEQWRQTSLADQRLVRDLSYDSSAEELTVELGPETGSETLTLMCRPTGLGQAVPSQAPAPDSGPGPEPEPQQGVNSLLVDQSDSNGGIARYEYSYEVTNTEISQLEVTFYNEESNFASERYTVDVSTERRGNLDTYGWQDSYNAAGDTYRVLVLGLNSAGETVYSEGFIDNAADGDAPVWQDTLVQDSSPTFASYTFTDTTQPNSAASYVFDYEVTNPSAFSEVELLVRNRNTGKVYQETDSSGQVEWENPNYGNSDSYDLIAQLQDTDGVVVEQVTLINDAADGSADPGSGSPGGGGGGSGPALEYVDGTLQSNNDGRLNFDLRNTRSNSITVSSISVSDSFSQRITDGSPLVRLSNGEVPASGNGFKTDGTSVNFDPQATITQGQTRSLRFQYFATRGGNSRVSRSLLNSLTPVSSAEQADLTVTLQTSEGPIDLYFERTD